MVAMQTLWTSKQRSTTLRVSLGEAQALALNSTATNRSDVEAIKRSAERVRNKYQIVAYYYFS
jgi:hypothetical protein